MTNNIRQFTLIELLTVIVVISVIVGITIPAYTRMMTGNAVTHANHLITSQLNMARTHACQKRRAVAVLFPDYSLTYNIDEPETMAQRAFRCAYVTGSGVDWTFDAWVPGTKWEYLPKGAFLPTPEISAAEKFSYIDASDSEELRREGLSSLDQSNKVSVKNVKDDSESKLFADGNFLFAIIFQSNGRPVITSDDKSPRVQVRQGVVTEVSKTDGITVLKADDGDGNVTNNYMIARVNRYTGAVVTKVPGEN